MAISESAEIEAGTNVRPGRYWIGFDLGGTKMLALLLDEEFKVVGRRRKKTKGHEGVEEGLRRIEGIIEQLLEETHVTKEQIAGIGIGCPGPVDWKKGIVKEAVNLKWHNVPVGDHLQKKFGCPVAVLNDVDAGVYGEYRFGAGIDAHCVLGIFPGTGIGGGCVYDGQIMHGKKLTCMEVGHIRISSSGRVSGAEMSGTLEAEASRLTIAAELAKLAFRGEAKHLMKLAGTDLSNMRSKVIAEAIKEGDEEVEKVVRRAAKEIGIAVANMVHLLCPDKIVLGGGLVEAMPNLFTEEVYSTARRNVFDCYKDEFEVKAAVLGDDAGAMGAAAWAAMRTATKTS
jgi:glucokinase